jgi:glucokinase
MNAIFQADEKAIAVDIGASMIKTALISRDGTLGATRRIETPCNPEDTAIGVLEGIRQVACDAQLDLNAIAGIGVSVAAFVTADGRIVATAHLGEDWVGYQLGRRLNDELTGNYYFALDAPAPTLGEAYYGAGRGCSDFAYVTVSTGVGAGLMLNGKIYTGGLGWAGGVGHIVVDSNGSRICTGCGNRGCLETYAATQGILALAREAIEQDPSSKLASLDPGNLSPQTICEAARQGDKAAQSVFAEAGRYLGLGLTNLVDILSVERIVVGGGVALAGDLLLEPARDVVRRAAFPPDHRTVEIVQAELGDLSGSYGAAAMVFNDIRINVVPGTAHA